MISLRRLAFAGLIRLLGTATFAAAQAKSEIRLIHILVIDQCSQEMLARYQDALGDSGIRRLMKDGAVFDNAELGYGESETCPGHASIATGTNPAHHGIVGNNWLDRSVNSSVYCVEDARYPILDSASAGRRRGISPANARVEGIGDALKFVSPRSRAWGIALKDRAAVMLGGQHPDGAIWWSALSGDFATSRYYGERLPAWADALNGSKTADRYFHAEWSRALPQSAYAGCSADSVSFETGAGAGLSNTLPKIIGAKESKPNRAYYEALECTPFGDELVFAAARAAVMAESLGVRGHADYLGISLSSFDEAGHLYGPASHEMLDMMVRTDRQIAEWLRFLDQRIGLEHCVIALTSDHGVGMPPEALPDSITDKGRYDSRSIRARLNAALTSRFVAAAKDTLPFIQRLALPWIWANDSLLAARQIPRDSALTALAVAARQLPPVADAVAIGSKYSQTDRADTSRLHRLLMNSIFDGRSGDVFVSIKPYWLNRADAANHGTPNRHDTAIPLILFGAGVRPGSYHDAVETQDIVPTLCAMAHIPPPRGSTGHAIGRAIRVR